LVDGEVIEVRVAPSFSISLLMRKKVIAFKNEPTADPSVVGRIYKLAETDISAEVEHHFWLEEELVVRSKNKLSIMFKNKVLQEFTGFYRLHNAEPLTSGFLACDGGVIKVYRRKDVKYELVCELIDENLMDCHHIVLAPQEDIIAYYSQSLESICYSTVFLEHMEQVEQGKFTNRVAPLPSHQIKHQKAFDYMVYSSSQSWFAAVNGKRIQLISSSSYQQYLEIELEGESNGSLSSAETKVRYI
jgi:uncharacterized protein YdhG (YjbR/CyaY superfamily)